MCCSAIICVTSALIIQFSSDKFAKKHIFIEYIIINISIIFGEIMMTTSHKLIKSIKNKMCNCVLD
jgi:hypothetical protein